MKRLKSILKTILILTITIGIFAVIFTRIDFFSALNVLSKAAPKYLFSAFLLTLISPILRAKRWQIILRAMSYSFPYWKCFAIVMGAASLASITPSKSGDLVKAYYLKKKVPITKTVGTVLIERVLDVLILVLLCFIGLSFYYRERYFMLVAFFLIGIVIFFIVVKKEIKLPVKESWNKKIQNIFLSTRQLTKNKKTFFLVFFLTIILWISAIFQSVIFFYAIGINIPLLFAMANIPIAIFIGQIPVTLGGMGTRDSAIIILFSNYGSNPELLSVGILFSLFRYWLLSLMGTPFMLKLLKKR